MKRNWGMGKDWDLRPKQHTYHFFSYRRWCISHFSTELPHCCMCTKSVTIMAVPWTVGVAPGPRHQRQLFEKMVYIKIWSLLLSGLFLRQRFSLPAVFYDFEGEIILTARENNSVKSTGHLTSITFLVENYRLLLHLFSCCPPECPWLTLGQTPLHKEQLLLGVPQASHNKLLSSGLYQQKWGWLLGQVQNCVFTNI